MPAHWSSSGGWLRVAGRNSLRIACSGCRISLEHKDELLVSRSQLEVVSQMSMWFQATAKSFLWVLDSSGK